MFNTYSFLAFLLLKIRTCKLRAIDGKIVHPSDSAHYSIKAIIYPEIFLDLEQVKKLQSELDLNCPVKVEFGLQYFGLVN